MKHDHASPSVESHRRRGWCRLGAAAAALALHTLANAGAGDLQLIVTPLAPNASYSDSTTSDPLRVVVGYTVSIANVGGNTINNIRLAGNAVMTDVDEKATLASVDGTTSCAAVRDASNASIGVDCALGQLKAGQAVPVFAVFFNSPDRDRTTPLPNGSDALTFAGNLFYAEGTGGVPNSTPQNSIIPFAAPVVIGTPSPVIVKSSVQRSGGLFFTGKNAITTAPNATTGDPGDTFATKIDVPTLATYTTAEIAETTVAGTSCGGKLQSCNTTTITVPSTTLFTAPLKIILRLDASQTAGNTLIKSIADIRVQYEGVDVVACPVAGQPLPGGVPCINRSFQYPKKSTPRNVFDPALAEDYEWEILNLRNGSYKVF